MKHGMVIRQTHHSLDNTLIVQYGRFTNNKTTNILDLSAYFYLFIFIYMGKVVDTSEAAKAVLGAILGYPWGMTTGSLGTMAHDVWVRCVPPMWLC